MTHIQSHHHPVAQWIVYKQNGRYSGMNNVFIPRCVSVLHKAGVSVCHCKRWGQGVRLKPFWPPTSTSVSGEASDVFSYVLRLLTEVNVKI